ncbi:hypothetical protein, partial [Pseudonocardia sp. SCN 73-27]|uniref:hypothetical protein n=1 Tax=Pseudonocardia sp. SCN 73-27 TaxID=1660132 RepID=UPI0025D7D26F
MGRAPGLSAGRAAASSDRVDQAAAARWAALLLCACVGCAAGVPDAASSPASSPEEVPATVDSAGFESVVVASAAGGSTCVASSAAGPRVSSAARPSSPVLRPTALATAASTAGSSPRRTGSRLGSPLARPAGSGEAVRASAVLRATSAARAAAAT